MYNKGNWGENQMQKIRTQSNPKENISCVTLFNSALRNGNKVKIENPHKAHTKTYKTKNSVLEENDDYMC